MKERVLIALVALTAGGAVVVLTGQPGKSSASTSRCVHSRVGGHAKCLAVGQHCSRRYQRTYQRHGYTCSPHNHRLAHVRGITGYPASYYTGPLGANEILPKSSTRALFIEWFGTIGLTPQQTRHMVLQRMSDTGRTFDGIGAQLDQLTFNGVTSEQWIKSLGSFPFITWSPSASVANVAAGLDDTELATVANRLKSLGSPVMIRPWHEFNGNWFPWSATVSTCPTWISGWRHMVDVFRHNGATNVGFDWSPSEGSDRAIRDACYPGDNYVDWVSSDEYNLCLGTTAWCTPLHGGWATFREMFDYTNMGSPYVSTYSAYAARKPFVVAETSSKCDPNNVNAKGNWFREIDTVAKPAMPYLRGVEFFDQDVSAAEPGNDWKVESCPVEQPSAASYSGWKDLSKTADWN